MDSPELIVSPSEFVALLNQTLEFAYPNITVTGELANLRVSKNRWVYFDLKDADASVKYFGTVYQLPGPLEDGMLLQVRGNPRLHPQYGFSVTVQFMQPVGEGSIKKAAALLEAKLRAEGLFDESRKRPLPYPPASVGLITSGESAAYHDFIKILNERWGGVEVQLANVQVQGEPAVSQIVEAIEFFNQHADQPEILVITRGGGSPEDLAAFSSEQVTRAVAASRVPTLVAIGHEVDISLAELAADKRASTPSNAVQLMVPDKTSEIERLAGCKKSLNAAVRHAHESMLRRQQENRQRLELAILARLKEGAQSLATKRRILQLLNPEAVLSRGYAIVRSKGSVQRSAAKLAAGESVSLQFQDGVAEATINKVK